MELTQTEKTQLSKVRQAKLEILFTDRDQEGNFLIFNLGQLYLRLVNEDRNRKIGSIYYVNDTIFYSKWEDEKDTYLKLDAWSIPLIIAKNVDAICYQTYDRKYWITKETILKEGSIMKFQDMERKIYVPKKFWSPTPVITESDSYTLLAGFTPENKSNPNMKKYIERVGEAWADVLTDVFDSPYMKDMGAKLAKARTIGKIIYPKQEDVFRAFRLTPYDKVKVVVIGQD